MSRWLALAEGASTNVHTPPDNMTKPDKTPDIQPGGAFCRVLSDCQVEGQVKPAAQRVDEMRHGFATNGRPKTWTGKIVSLDAWRQLSEWERHGPDGRQWNGLTQSWGNPR
jgi:hypothetical protein